MSIMSSLLPAWCARLCRVVPDVGEHFFSLGDSLNIIVPLDLVVSLGFLTFVVWLKKIETKHVVFPVLLSGLVALVLQTSVTGRD